MLVGFCVLVPFSLSAENLLKNPSFSEIVTGEARNSVDLLDAALLADWSTGVRQPEGKTQLATFVLAPIGLDGDGTARIVAPEGQLVEPAIAEFSQNVRVAPSKKYYFSVYRRIVPYPRNSYPSVVVEERGRDGSHLTYHMAKIDTDPDASTSAWVHYSVVFETSPKTTQLTISLRLQNIGSGSVEYDAAQLIPIEIN
jgi:hypothetical protein